MQRFLQERQRFLDSADSAAIVAEWMATDDFKSDDFEIPANGFTSFNHFFTRQLKPGVRPIAEPNEAHTVVSPADCDVWEIEGPLTASSEIEVKAQQYNVGALLNDTALGERFVGGRALICFLMANNYHRFHAPVNGKLTKVSEIGGLYFGSRGFISHFHEYHRALLLIETERYGAIAMVPVGIGEISSITLTQAAQTELTKGGELGHFAYGGSAIILLFEKDRLRHFVHEHQGQPLTRQMGQYLGRLGGAD